MLSTNATHQDGARITVFEFDLGKMGVDPEKLRILKKADPTNFAEAKELQNRGLHRNERRNTWEEMGFTE